ncbi:MAG: DUF669 domain-containing protein [Victivallaceae bacterium]|nr:DUF669 domain-containing protein [Victivallaceae bacterium]
MATLNFNANDVEPSVAFEAVPAGKYIAVIIDSEIKQTKSGNGNYLEMTFEITEGEYKGRKVWARLNIDNPSAEAVKIARGELSAICRAVNVMTPQDSVDLHNLPLEITVKCKKRDDSDEITNEIKGYAAKANSAAPAQKQQQSAPWKRG